MDRKAESIPGGQLRENFHKWLSPPDPSINSNTARKAYHDGTAAWFTRSVTFNHWKALDSENLLWIYGKGISPYLKVP